MPRRSFFHSSLPDPSPMKPTQPLLMGMGLSGKSVDLGRREPAHRAGASYQGPNIPGQKGTYLKRTSSPQRSPRSSSPSKPFTLKHPSKTKRSPCPSPHARGKQKADANNHDHSPSPSKDDHSKGSSGSPRDKGISSHPSSDAASTSQEQQQQQQASPQKPAEPEEPSFPVIAGDQGITELMREVRSDDAWSVLQSLKSKQCAAQLNAKDVGGLCPLLWAVHYNRARMVRLLVAFGADIHAKDNSGARSEECRE